MFVPQKWGTTLDLRRPIPERYYKVRNITAAVIVLPDPRTGLGRRQGRAVEAHSDGTWSYQARIHKSLFLDKHKQRPSNEPRLNYSADRDAAKRATSDQLNTC